MRVIVILHSFLMACSFLTILPVPTLEWKENQAYALCPMLPVVGGVLGGFWALLLALLSRWDASALLRGVVMALSVLSLTGGLHMDGLMDTCDALFSRRDRETRLKILSDTHAGSFAIMGCAAVLTLQVALFAELLSGPIPVSSRLLCAAALVPVWSRLGMGLLLVRLPFARSEGLARMFGAARDADLVLPFGVAAFGLELLSLWLGAWALGPVWLAALFLWRRVAVSVFGGITGDLLGAFAELSETALLFALRGLS